MPATGTGTGRRSLLAGLRAAQRAAPRLLGALLRTTDRLPVRRQRSPIPVTFLLWNHYAMGGTITTVLRQAGALAQRGVDVTVVSVVRHAGQEDPFHAVPPGVATRVLVDRQAMADRPGIRGTVERRLDNLPTLTSQISEGRERFGSLLVDLRVIDFVARRRGIVVGTRAGLNLAIARFGHPRAVRVWQEHLQLAHYRAPVRRSLGEHSRRVHAVVCLTEVDACDYRRLMGSTRTVVQVIPNAIPDQLPPAADLGSMEVVAVGRLEAMKGFDLLIAAFAQCLTEHPSWRLRIVGTGRQRQALKAQVRELGLSKQVEFVGKSHDVPAELQRASVFVLASRFEPFGIVLLEAMSVGLAIASFDAKNGPREILTDGENALVVPTGDVDGLARAMQRLMQDEELRHSLGAQARQDAMAYRLGPVTDQWVSLLEHLVGPQG